MKPASDAAAFQTPSHNENGSKATGVKPRNSRLSLLDIVGGIRQSIQGGAESMESGGAELRYRSQSPTSGYQQQATDSATGVEESSTSVQQ